MNDLMNGLSNALNVALSMAGWVALAGLLTVLGVMVAGSVDRLTHPGRRL